MKMRLLNLDKNEIIRMVERREITPEEGFQRIKTLERDKAKAHSKTVCYHDIWEKTGTHAVTGRKISGNVLVFDDSETVSHALKEHPETTGEVVLVKSGENYGMPNAQTYSLNPGRAEDYHRLLTSLREQNRMPEYIIHLWSQERFSLSDAGKYDENRLTRGIEKSFYSLFLLSKALIEQKPVGTIEILYVYPDSKDKPQPQYAAIGGFAKTLRLENPKLICKTVALPDLSRTADILISEFQSTDGIEVRYKEDQRQVKRLEVAELLPGDDPMPTLLREKGVYLLTGGAGGLGRIFAEYLADRVKARLVLTGRSEPGKSLDALTLRLKELGSEVIYVRADISKRDDVKALMTRAKSQFKEVNGIIHGAGVIRDAYILKKNPADISSVLAPKVFGPLWLDEVSKEEPLDFFVMFSSIASVLGSIGQCDYAYANSFMDHFAEMRERLRSEKHRNGQTISINWPLWRDGGMHPDKETEAWMKRNTGLELLAGDSGIRAFEAVLNAGRTRIMVTYGEADKIKNTLNAVGWNISASPGLQNFKGLQSRKRSDTRGREADGLQEGAENYFKKFLSETLRIPVSRIRSHEPLEKYGIDSVMIMDLTRELEKNFGELSKTLFFEYQTLTELAAYFADNHGERLAELSFPRKPESASETPDLTDPRRRFFSSDKSSNESPELPFQRKRKTTAVYPDFHIKEETLPAYEKAATEEAIAIIGISGRYPMAGNLTEFWENLKAGKDCISEIPADRWDYHQFYDADKEKQGKIYTKWGGFIDDVDKFDALFFNITPREAEVTDPQERLFLETVWHTLEDAGYSKTSLWGHQVGVFVGVMWGEYQLFGPEAVFAGYPMIPGSSYASVANRISYYFNFSGPSIALDTMCSSSITAIHLACQSLRLGESRVAVAGGVNVSIHPQKYLQLCQGRFASSEGRCGSFGEGGDGYVPGEGVGAVLLKPLSRAVSDGDHIYAVIRGSSLNHGGKTNGYTVPNPNAQAALISDVIRKTGIAPGTISYLEAHGTGTVLGDPIEITGLLKAFRTFTQEKQYCSIGSVKSNIGHSESAAGIAALTKVILQMKHKQLVPSLHAETLNPHINFKDSPFYVQQELAEWVRPLIEVNGEKRRCPRRAGISSFGAGGSNVHLILEEYVNEPEYADERSDASLSVSVPQYPQIIVISAKDQERLAAYAGKLKAFLSPDISSEEIGSAKEIVPDEILKTVSEMLYVSETEIDPDEPFDEYGLDAVALSRLAERLSNICTMEITPALLSEYSSVSTLVQYLLDSPVNKETSRTTSFSPPPLAAIAYTLQTGREPMEERLAMVISDSDELKEKLTRYIRGERDIESLYQGNARAGGNLLIEGRAGKEFVRILMEDGELDKLARLWVSGAEIEWKLLYPDKTPRRISLPLYPFARERHWIGGDVQGENDEGTAEESGQAIVTRNLKPASREPITDYLIAAMSAITRLDPKRVNPDYDFEAYGLDSVMIAQLNTDLERQFGRLPSTLFFKYKNLSSLAGYFVKNHPEKSASLIPESDGGTDIKTSEVFKTSEESRTIPGSDGGTDIKTEESRTFTPFTVWKSGTAKSPVQLPTNDGIAVIGLSGRYPYAENIDGFWENLKAGRDCISEIPKQRWDYKAYPGMYCKWGGFLSDADKFDPSFFNISPNTARFMDPQERLFLQTAWSCVEDAGYTQKRLENSQAGDRRGNVGVFTGVTFNDYQLHSAAEWEKGKIIPLSSQIFSVANRVSYHLNFSGPSLSVDTACSSSLYAIHLACESILRRECDMAVAGGVNLSMHPAKYVTLCMSQFAASDGRCRSFGEGGDGYVPGEGVGAVFLKPLRKAVEAGDHIYAVVRGTAVNHDGKTQGYSVPNPVAQSEVIRAAMTKADIHPRTISCVEAHGTGTALGDPIEITGLSDVYEEYTSERQYCSIGSVKSNIGHPEAAAGIAQMTKVLLQMKHQSLVPSLMHSKRMNPNIDFENSPFFVQQTLERWEQPIVQNTVCPRRAGVSSFGAGGVNVHIVLEEYATENGNNKKGETRGRGGSVVIPLSAKTRENLRTYADQLKTFLNRNNTNGSGLEDISYTLQMGREAMPFRAAFAVSTRDELIEKLDAYIRKEGDAERKIPSSGTRAEETVYLENLLRKGMSTELAEIWTKGADFEWDPLHTNGNNPRRVSLPTYPFSKERYWVFGAEEPSDSSEDRKSSLPDSDPIRADVEETDAARVKKQSVLAFDFLEELADAPDEEQEEMLAEFLQEKLGDILGFAPPNLPDFDQGFFEMGMESLQVAQFQSNIEKDLGVKTSDTAIFDYPNIRAFSGYLMTLISYDELDIPDTEPLSVTLDSDTPKDDFQAGDPYNVSQEELNLLIPDPLPGEIRNMNVEEVEKILESEISGLKLYMD